MQIFIIKECANYVRLIPLISHVYMGGFYKFAKSNTQFIGEQQGHMGVDTFAILKLYNGEPLMAIIWI